MSNVAAWGIVIREGTDVDARVRQLMMAVALVTLVLSVGGAAAASAGKSFPDPVGDVQGGAGPDVTAISVSHTASTLTFRFRFAKAPPLGVSVSERWADMLLVGLDVPPRSLKRTAQGWRGLDFYFGTHGTEQSAMLLKSPKGPSGRGKVLARPPVAVNARTLSVVIARRLLGNPAWVEFVVAVGRETSDQTAGGGSDEAPTHGFFHYQLGT